MNNTVAFKLVALVAAIMAPALYAGTDVKVNVPFAFVAGNQTLPAGQYRISINEPQHMIQIQGAGQSLFVLGQSAESGKVQEQTKVVFERYGDRAFLSRVWIIGQKTGAELLKSRSEVNQERMSQKAGSHSANAGGSQD